MKKVFCDYCTTFNGYERDLETHVVRKHKDGFSSDINYIYHASVRKINCLYQCSRTTLFFIFTFKSYFGHDVVTKIAQLIYKTRTKLPLWNIHSVYHSRKPNKFDRKIYETKMMLLKKDY